MEVPADCTEPTARDPIAALSRALKIEFRSAEGAPAISYVVIFLLGVLLYFPFASKMLYHVDSVGFALAIHHFDLHARHPQLPGYPLYVLALRLVQRLLGTSDNETIVFLSAASTIASAMLFYRLARAWMRWNVALLASIALLTSPVVWFNAEIAMRYPVEMLCSLALAVSCLYLLNGSRPARYSTPVLWGLSGGFSSITPITMLPLVGCCSLAACAKSRRSLLTIGALASAAVGLWLVPVAYMSGGIHAYASALRNKSSADSALSFVLNGERAYGLRQMSKNILVLATFVAIGVAAVLLTRVHAKMRSPFPRSITARTRFLALWAAPGVCLECLTTIGHSGYVLPYLPALLLLALPDLSSEACDRTRADPYSQRLPRLLIAAIFLQSAFFLLAPQAGGRVSDNWVRETLVRRAILGPTRTRIEQSDTTLRLLVSEIRAKFPPGQTLLIIPVGDELPRSVPITALYAQASYYLPDLNQRILYTTQLPEFRNLGWGGAVVADVNHDRWTFMHTNIVDIPRSIRWVVWFCNSGSQPYCFDHSWSRAHIGGATQEIIFADWRESMASFRRWGPFEFPSRKYKRPSPDARSWSRSRP